MAVLLHHTLLPICQLVEPPQAAQVSFKLVLTAPVHEICHAKEISSMIYTHC